jgi:hypothetical protein
MKIALLCISIAAAIGMLYEGFDALALHYTYRTAKTVQRGERYWFDLFLLKSKLELVQDKRNRRVLRALICASLLVSSIFLIML